MKRRSVLRTMGTGLAAVGTGCLGTGGEVVVTVQRDVHVEPGDAWIERAIPDVSEPGGAIQYIVRSEQPFDVYVFTDGTAFGQYHAYLKGDDPAETPAANPEYSQTALPQEDGDLYEASTTDGGAREPLDTAGPYYFAVDHSNYRMETRVEEFAEELTAFVDLKVIRKRTPF